MRAIPLAVQVSNIFFLLKLIIFECFQDGLPGPTDGNSDSTFFMMAMVWTVLAAVLFLMRPSNLRGLGDRKPSQGGPGDRDRDGPGSDQPPAVY